MMSVIAPGLRPPPGLVERQLQAVLEAPELLRTAFQPILSLRSGEVVAYEGFSRFTMSPRRSPDLWFEDAARLGLGVELQALAIRRIVAATLEASLPEATFLTLNVSPSSLVDPRIESALAGLEPGRLVLELTEEEAVYDYRALRRAMRPYLARGVRFAVDDAGAGFASMRHVIELQPAFVKLDAYLIRGMRSRRTVRAFLRAINGFAAEIGATLVTEGVEEPQDLQVLVETGYPILVQGFGIARPGAPWPAVSATAMQAWRGAVVASA